MEKLTPIATLTGHSDRVWQVTWSPNGKLLASCGGDKTIRIWCKEMKEDKEEWVCKATLEEAHSRTIRRVAWSPDGQYLAAASFDSTISIWSFSPSFKIECIATLEGHENEVKSVSWSASGALLATCSRDKSVWIWEMQSDNEFECVSVLSGHSQDVKHVLWHPVKEILFSCSYDDTIKVWKDDEDDWYCAHTLTGHKSTVWEIAFNSTGDRLVSCSDDKNLIIWDTTTLSGETPKNLCTITGFHSRTIFSVDWSTKDIIATGSADDSIKLFAQDPEVKDGVSFALIGKVEHAHSSDVNGVSWNPSNPNLLASCSDDGTIKLWQLNSE